MRKDTENLLALKTKKNKNGEWENEKDYQEQQEQCAEEQQGSQYHSYTIHYTQYQVILLSNNATPSTE